MAKQEVSTHKGRSFSRSTPPLGKLPQARERHALALDEGRSRTHAGNRSLERSVVRRDDRLLEANDKAGAVYLLARRRRWAV